MLRKKIMLIIYLCVAVLFFNAVIFAEVIGFKQDAILDSPTHFPAGLTWDGHHLWLIDRKDALLLKVCPESGKVLAKIETPGYRPSGLTWDGEQLWITDLESGLIYRLNPETRVITRVIDSPVRNPYGIAWDGKFLWLLDANRSKSSVRSIDPADGTTITKFKAPTEYGTGIVYDGKYLWISDRRRNEIYMISPKHGSVINVIHAPGPFSYGLAWDSKMLWNVDYQTDKIYRLDVEGIGKYYLWGKKKEEVIFTTVINNQGTGTIKTFDLYYAYPRNMKTQKLLGGIEWSQKPVELFKDKWGQKVARFLFKDLKPAQSKKIEMKVKMETSAVRQIIFPEKIKGEIPKEIKGKYLADDLKYDIHNPYIQELAKKIVEKETNPYWKARKIFEYLIANMYYELSGGWNTAPTVLKRGNGSCSEYTFSFISLCRAVGIPARYVGTLVIRYDDASWDDVYHRWAQIYLPGYGWINVDGNRGDKEWPADQGRAFGGYSNSFLVTTEGGGGSEYLRFNYNYDYKYTAIGRVNVRINQMAEWEPIVD